MNDNGSEPGLDFTQSIEHNIRWIKQLAVEHDCSQGLVASAALMTMTMMDHHRFNQLLTKINADLNVIQTLLCQSDSSPVPTKPH